ncbi:hypothetical protein BO78DRAFT_469844 [Aspergillus sclerotiicarbonarius CBS 121057]|uniref:GET complex, subunit GET2 n=1 Tax=Aspergillus sclerotiicarbonarius (strain CBS 121057 / IBT 28362) TaxID=1448318 RepID=A0A319ERV1_ASPSB|nr:hypothetical protein BO78DRAFT_469844 [Aspergillus sclerotiicarbonarius CBS 121057]
MSSPAEESPAQRAARLRRERREAKIKGDGAARLDKITSLSGRTPTSLREETSPSPSPTPQPPATASPAPEPRATIAPEEPQPAFPDYQQQQQQQGPESLQAQQELFRALLRQSAPPQGAMEGQQEAGEEEDPTMKLLSSLMNGETGNLNENALPGGQSPADLLTGLGVPPFVASMLGEATRQKTDAEKREILVWKVLHVVFSVLIGVYLLVLFGSSVATFGSQPPPPATARNPFLFFTTGELVLSGARIMMKGGKGGLGMWLQLAKDISRDGSLVLFLFGMANWWHREWVAN